VQRNKPAPTSPSYRDAHADTTIVQHGGSRDFSTDAIKSALITNNKNLRRAHPVSDASKKNEEKEQKNETIRSSDWFTREGTQCHGGSYLDDNSWPPPPPRLRR
jgi:hypothetical protein